MVTTQELLSSLLHTTERNHYLLTIAKNYAVSHGLKSVILGQIREFDQIESDLQYIFARRGWETQELQPAERWMVGLRFRCRTDAAIAEYMITMHTRDTIRILKLRNQWHSADEQAVTVLQKYLDSKLISSRQMQPYL